MSKKHRSAPAGPIVERLEARGLDASAPLAALDGLASTWGTDPELEAYVIELVGGFDDDSAGAKLAALAERTSSKAVRREIKRALYRLEQRGRWKPPEAPAPPRARDLLGPADDATEAWMSRIDPLGGRLVWMARRHGSGVASLSALIDEDAGIREFRSGETTRKSLREAQREITRETGIGLVEVPWEWAHEVLRRAFARTERGRFPETPSVLKALAPHASADSEHVRHPIDALLDRAAVAEDESALAGSTQALAEPETGGWLLPLGWLEKALDSFSEADSSLVVVSPALKEERLRESFEGAVATILDAPDRRERFADRLEETAYLLARRGAEAAARGTLAAALAARAGRPITEIPILADVTRRSLALAFEARAERQAEAAKSSLVMTPQQALAEQQRQRARRGR